MCFNSSKPNSRLVSNKCNSDLALLDPCEVCWFWMNKKLLTWFVYMDGDRVLASLYLTCKMRGHNVVSRLVSSKRTSDLACWLIACQLSDFNWVSDSISIWTVLTVSRIAVIMCFKSQNWTKIKSLKKLDKNWGIRQNWKVGQNWTMDKIEKKAKLKKGQNWKKKVDKMGQIRQIGQVGKDWKLDGMDKNWRAWQMSRKMRK